MYIPFVYKKYIIDYFNENKKSLLIYLIIIFILYPIESILVSKVKANLFTSLDFSKNSSKSYFQNPIFKSIIILCLVYLIIIVLNTIIKYLSSNLYNTYSSFISKEIFEKTISNYQEQYEDIKIGKYITRLSNLTNELKSFLRHILGILLIEFIIMTFISFYLLTINTKIGIVIIVTYLFFGVTTYFYSQYIIKKSTEEAELLLEINENVSDNLSNLMNIYINNEHENEIEKYKNSSESYSNTSKKVENITNFYVVCMNILALTAFFIIMFILFNEYQDKKVDKNLFIFIVGLITIYLVSFYKLNKESAFMFYKIGNINSYNSFVESISKNIDNNMQNNNKLKEIDFDGGILLSNISFKYNSDNDFIFNNFTLNIESNKITGIMGSSGSGKTTLSKLIMKLYKLNNGQILINNVDIQYIDTNYLRSNIVYVNQKTTLYSKTVIENIMYGNNHLKEADVLRFMKRYDLLDIYSKLDKGIYSDCGVGGSFLSIGMQKIIILLRAILKPNYKIIIFDEPLAGIDKNNRMKIIKMIKDISNNRTVIIITHDEDILPICDSITRL
jgi:ATP-binding cassette subfamily B protein